MKKIAVRTVIIASLFLFGGIGDFSTQPEAQAGPFGRCGVIRQVEDSITIDGDPVVECAYHFFRCDCSR